MHFINPLPEELVQLGVGLLSTFQILQLTPSTTL